MRTALPTIFAASVLLASAAADASSGEGEFRRERHSALNKIHARALSELGERAVRFSTEPALGGPSTVVEVRPDRESRYRVTVSYLAGHPNSGWEKNGAFHFWIAEADFVWLLGEVEQAERDLGASDGGTLGDDIIVCTDGPGYLSEIRSHNRTRWISGFCGQNANNAIAPLMAQLVRYGTSRMLRDMDDEDLVPLRAAQVTP